VFDKNLQQAGLNFPNFGYGFFDYTRDQVKTA
jgi:hypothetical protein